MPFGNLSISVISSLSFAGTRKNESGNAVGQFLDVKVYEESQRDVQ